MTKLRSETDGALAVARMRQISSTAWFSTRSGAPASRVITWTAPLASRPARTDEQGGTMRDTSRS
jgi:hypothetical protein